MGFNRGLILSLDPKSTFTEILKMSCLIDNSLDGYFFRVNVSDIIFLTVSSESKKKMKKSEKNIFIFIMLGCKKLIFDGGNLCHEGNDLWENSRFW